MPFNSVCYHTFIIRSQIEYSAITQTVIVRCILETPATGQHDGFTDIEAVLAAVRTKLLEVQKQIIPPDLKNENI